mmetsp:Transcript_9122/g.22933  ORF Transcript_9122/g.22933 Transcript_9122/m.22933 type:complete len:283 (+) Transcript_9122:595-1443(+)
MASEEQAPGESEGTGHLADGDHTLTCTRWVVQMNLLGVLAALGGLALLHDLLHMDAPADVYEHCDENREYEPHRAHSNDLRCRVVDTSPVASVQSPVVLGMFVVVPDPARVPLGQPRVQLLRHSESHGTRDQICEAQGGDVIFVLLRHLGPDLLVRSELSIVLNLPLSYLAPDVNQHGKCRCGKRYHQQTERRMDQDGLVLKMGPGMDRGEPRDVGGQPAESLATDAHEALVGVVASVRGLGVASMDCEVVVPLWLGFLMLVLHLRHLQNQYLHKDEPGESV